jgi:hypothetical protein
MEHWWSEVASTVQKVQLFESMGMARNVGAQNDAE